MPLLTADIGERSEEGHPPSAWTPTVARSARW